MKPFAYARPTDVAEALQMLQGGARPLGGGTNLYDLMKDGVESPDRLVDIRLLPLSGVRLAEDRALHIGATTTNSDLAVHPDTRRHYPALTRAILSGASGQLRNMATVGGNLLQRTRCSYFGDITEPCNKRKPGTGCSALEGENHNHAVLGWSPSCVATHPSDMAVAMLAFDAVVHYDSPAGTGEIPLVDFYRPVGETPHVETALPPGALITEVVLGPAPASARSTYRKVRERASYAFATVSVAAALEVSDGVVRDVRIALGGVASHPWRASTAEAALVGAPATPASFLAAAREELGTARPLAHNGYKIPLAINLVEAVLSDLAGTAQHTLTPVEDDQ